MIRRTVCASLFAALVWVILTAACSSRKVTLPPYGDFAASRQQIVPKTLLEIYGRYRATSSGKNIRSEFNLLMNPGESAYLEIVDPGKKLLYSVSLDHQEIWLLWAQDGNFIQEPATPENLNAILGMPVLPDDLLHLVAGYGLKFGDWQMKSLRKDGWSLERPPFQAEITLREDLSNIVVASEGAPRLIARYDQYRMTDNRSLPNRIRFEMPERNVSIELDIEKNIPRDEPVSRDLFAVKLPANAKRLQLKEIYRGQPLLLQ